MKKWIKENRFNIIVMAIYMICSFLMVIFHESWRDEAQAWMIARDLNLSGIIGQMQYEGHFLLWYLILMPFAKMGFPYETIKIISWIIVSASVWLILKKAPFKLHTKILFIFTFPMIYLYPVIARCYCLIPLAITLIAIIYKERGNKPFRYILSIVLLANTHVVMLGLVGMLLLDFYLEQLITIKQKNKKEKIDVLLSFVLVIVLLILTALPLCRSLTTNKWISVDTKLEIRKIAEIFLHIFTNLMLIFGTNKVILGIIFGLVYICATYEAKNYKANFTIIVISIFYQLVLYATIYESSYQRAATCILIVFLFTWIQIESKTKENIESKKNNEEKIICIITKILLVINILFGLNFVVNEIKYPYSSAKETAKFINEKLEENSIIACNDLPLGSSVIPYSKNVRFYNPREDNFYTYVTWNYDREEDEKIEEELIKKVRKRFSNEENIYFLYTGTLSEEGEKEENQKILEKFERKGKILKIFESKRSLCGENYNIYKIN